MYPTPPWDSREIFVYDPSKNFLNVYAQKVKNPATIRVWKIPANIRVWKMKFAAAKKFSLDTFYNSHMLHSPIQTLPKILFCYPQILAVPFRL